MSRVASHWPKVDPKVVEAERGLARPILRFVCRLLRAEHYPREPSLLRGWVASESGQLPRIKDLFPQRVFEGFVGLEVAPHADELSASRHDHGSPEFGVGNRTHDARWPARRAIDTVEQWATLGVETAQKSMREETAGRKLSNSTRYRAKDLGALFNMQLPRPRVERAHFSCENRRRQQGSEEFHGFKLPCATQIWGVPGGTRGCAGPQVPRNGSTSLTPP